MAGVIIYYRAISELLYLSCVLFWVGSICTPLALGLCLKTTLKEQT